MLDYAPVHIKVAPHEVWEPYQFEGRRWFRRQADDAWAWKEEFVWGDYSDPSNQRKWQYSERMNAGIR